jgi:PAS domain S-box-containing protein
MAHNDGGRSLRTRTFISFLGVLPPVLVLLAAAVELLLMPYLTSRTWEELANSTRVLTDAVQASASVAIRNHLKAIAERNREIARNHIELAEKGVMTRREAVDRLRRIFLSQRVGGSGYIYCIDSRGIALVHPKPEVEGADYSHFAFVREQMRRKSGYLEYDWRNPGEDHFRPKALYMVYFAPLDWIISASCYRSELNELLNPQDFREMVLSLRFGKRGYSYVFNKEGRTLIHPELKNVNVLDQPDMPADFVRVMLANDSGRLEYEWRNPSEPEPLRKIAVYESLPEYGWVIVSSAYVDEVMAPVRIARTVSYGGMLLLLLAVGVAAYYLSGRITRPVGAMVRRLDRNARNGVREPLPVSADDELGRLGREFNAFLSTIDRQTTELRRERERYQSLFEASPDAVFLLRGLEIVDCNPATFAIFGGDPESIIGRSVMDLSPPTQPDGRTSADAAGEIARTAADQPLQTFQWVHLTVDGREFDAEVRIKPFGQADAAPMLLAFVRDITEERSLQEQLHHAQKLDAVGRLAGGVAHDFNNMLGGISGAAELLKLRLAPDDALRSHVRLILDTVERAAELSGRLLAFSRKGRGVSTPVDLHRVLRDAFRIFRSGLDPRIETEVDLAAGSSTVVGDPSQLQNVFLNLLINARDAMPEGGALRVATREVMLGAPACAESPFDLTPGPHIEIMVVDTGFGMDDATRNRIFEPFFTTKEEGRGTGLGLASAYGVVKNHGGEIRVESLPGVGASFTLRLPCTAAPAVPAPETIRVARGSGTILLVDDDEVLRTTGRLMLEELGYRALTARDGAEAVDLFNARAGEIDLVILDMVMPRMNGRDAFRAIREIDATARILIASGFSDRRTIRDLEAEGLLGFVQKPYRLPELNAVISRVLPDIKE